MTEKNNLYIIYRDRETKQITRYSMIYNIPTDLDYHITKFNERDEKSTVEIATDKDHLSLIEIAENKYNLKLRDLKDIESKLDDLQIEIYNLKDKIKETK